MVCKNCYEVLPRACDGQLPYNGPMDPRYARSRERLRAAVYELAAVKPINDVQVQELCERAGVTRDTFYRHATSPVALLASVLADQLAAMSGVYTDLAGGSTPDEAMGTATRDLLRYVLRHVAVYRNCMQPGMIAPIREVIESTVVSSLLHHFEEHPEILPATPEPTPEVLAIYAKYGAGGLVGAIEAWVSGPEPNLEEGTAALLATNPCWWFTD